MLDEIRAKIEQEIERLQHELKVVLPKAIQKALEHGDLRENAEYKSAKERQSFLEGKKAQVQKRLAALSLVNLDKIPHDRVGFGSTVHLKDDHGSVTIYQLVMPEDADAEHGLISTASPIGRALLNKEEGDEATVTTPNGSRRFEVVKLLTIHDE